MPTHVVILGAGFGGLELSTRLAEELTDEMRVTLIDKNDSFVFGFTKLDVLFGRKTTDEVRIPYRELARPTVTFRQETITSIDPVARRVVTDAGSYDADVLVIALGADLDVSATPGLAEGGYPFYTLETAAVARDALAAFDRGAVVISVLGPFFKCPGAPNETAFLLHDFLTRRGTRDDCSIYLTTPMAKPIPVSDEASVAIVAMLEERGIEYSPSTLVTHLDPAAKTAYTADGRSLPYDLFLGIPVHCAPAVCVASGLTEEDGWIAVDPRTFATKFPDVYAVGDVTSAPVPRSGAIAEGEAGTVADGLVARLRTGATAPPYSGRAVCYLEMGDLTVSRFDVDFLSGASPTATFSPPTLALAEEKHEFGASRRRRWFGP